MNVILFSTFFISFQYRKQPKDYKDALQYLNAALTILFTLEAALKLFAFKQVFYLIYSCTSIQIYLFPNILVLSNSHRDFLELLQG